MGTFLMRYPNLVRRECRFSWLPALFNNLLEVVDGPADYRRLFQLLSSPGVAHSGKEIVFQNELVKKRTKNVETDEQPEQGEYRRVQEQIEVHWQRHLTADGEPEHMRLYGEKNTACAHQECEHVEQAMSRLGKEVQKPAAGCGRRRSLCGESRDELYDQEDEKGYSEEDVEGQGRYLDGSVGPKVKDSDTDQCLNQDDECDEPMNGNREGVVPTRCLYKVTMYFHGRENHNRS